MAFVVSVTLSFESAEKPTERISLDLLLQVISQIYTESGPRKELQDSHEALWRLLKVRDKESL